MNKYKLGTTVYFMKDNLINIAKIDNISQSEHLVYYQMNGVFIGRSDYPEKQSYQEKELFVDIDDLLQSLRETRVNVKQV